ncbi:MAG: sensor histidine kinase [Pseudomonadota bacterium]|nr:sensor histidine kinase [Pseudomonadota bacterium]
MTPSPAPPPRRHWTLARRIAVLALVPTALVLSSGGLWLRTQIHGAVYESFAQVLHEQHERVAARLHATASGVAENTGAGDAFSAIYSGWYWQAASSPLSHTSGATPLGRSRSLWDAPPIDPLHPIGPARLGLLHGQGPMQEPLLGTRRSLSLPGRDTPVQLTVLGPARALQANLRRIDHILLASGAALFVLLAAMLLVQVRVGLAPLRRLTQAIAAQRQGAAAPRLDTLPAGADLAPLQHELAALLSRNERVVSRARAHAADLNHALKKPLALLAASASGAPSVPAAEVMQHITGMTRLIDRYQARTLSDALHARAAATLPAVPVSPCLHELLQAMRKLHMAQELHWHLALPPEASTWHWRGDRTDLEEALGNLLDNAGKWAASHVRMSAWTEGASLCIAIEDDGPGMPAAQLQAAGQRGLRFDESVQGSGLGLAIASQIAQAYGGQLQLGKSPDLKGLCARLCLGGLHTAPAAPAPA